MVPKITGAFALGVAGRFSYRPDVVPCVSPSMVITVCHFIMATTLARPIFDLAPCPVTLAPGTVATLFIATFNVVILDDESRHD